ncbi:signal peptidase I [Niveispirillum lacus]|uniref:Signal peptidase I n=1 Tax=Niveispirillum lacus TaxID=1981099 RepID=A0A255YVJ1_9PROT|nr:signal peptidase I [Niveispirillum lacus]OYQ32704.1 signal peptidase I [Niveispirillum lacus]
MEPQRRRTPPTFRQDPLPPLVETQPHPVGGGWGETLRIILVTIAVVVGIRTLSIEAFNIPSGSMVPTLLVGDYLFVNKASYGYSRYSLPSLLRFGGKAPPVTTDCKATPGRLFGRLPERGDVAVFKLPKDTSVDYIKRIVGLPCDRLQMIGGALYVNGEMAARIRVPDFVLHEAFGGAFTAPQYIETLPGGHQHPVIEISGDQGLLDDTPVFTVPPGYVFGMGDSRDNSQDSRVPDVVGFVPVENLVGRATTIFLSVKEEESLWRFWRWGSAIRTERFWERVD